MSRGKGRPVGGWLSWRRWLSIAAALALAVLPSISAAPTGARSRGPRLPIYRNRAYSPAERAADLVARMTLAEKASQMVSSQSPAIPRLGIQAYGWWNESVHGVARLQLGPGMTLPTYNTTSYPTSLALGSTWDPSLMYQEASAISDEAREIVPANAFDLDFFSPTVNLSRDPRWGRNEETFSEDPLLTAQIASQYVDGLEGKNQQGRLLPQGGGYLKAIATLKHYAANNSEVNRLTGSADVDESTLRDYYTSQFRQIIQQSQPGALMAAFNSVDETPATSNLHLLDTLARQTFGFGGYITSDCDGIAGLVAYHGWRPPGWSRPLNDSEAHAFANAAGTDLNCTVTSGDPYTNQNLLPAAADAGIRTQTDIYNTGDMDTSLVRLFTARIKLGEFDNINNEPWVRAARARVRPGSWVNSNSNNAVTETPARLGLARSVADHALVLLKNSPVTHPDGTTGKLLPIGVPASGPFKVAVIGSPANPASMYLGGYSSIQGTAGAANETNPYQGIKRAIQAINPGAQVDFYSGFTSGSSVAGLTTIDPAAVNATAGYNDVIVYVGTDPSAAREDLDRSNLTLPGLQTQLIADVAAVNPNTIAVMNTLGPVDTGAFEPHVGAMLWSSYNGQRTGDALADVLLGKYDPSGHLPFTWYQNESELPAITDYRIRPGPGTPGRTYMYFGGPISYPFGYGLSYTTFRSSNLRVDHPSTDPNKTVLLSATVTNTGSVWGEDLVQLYVTEPGGPAQAQGLLKRLEGFRQVPLYPGHSATVTFALKVSDLARFNDALNRYTIADGRYGIQLSSSAAATDVQLGAYLSVHGRLLPAPRTVSAQPVISGDGARGVQSRVLFPDGATVDPQLTVSMNDDSLYHYGGHGRQLPAGATVRFRSDHPNVVSVGPGGTITTVGNGVATVTATVTYNGGSASTQFVLRVLSKPSAITLDGTPLPAFDMDRLSYDVLIGEKVTRPPRISVTMPDRSARVGIRQATTVPGTATVSVTGPDGLTTTYTVNFAHPALSDAFAGPSVGPQWTWIRHDAANEQVAAGSLNITAEHGDLLGRSGRNLLVQPALGDWTIQSKLTLSAPPHAQGQEAGIIAYQDDADFVKLAWQFSSGAAQLTETTSDSLSGVPVSRVLTSFATAGRLVSTVWLRMVKRGTHYATYYSLDGVRFIPMYGVGASLSNVEVGLFAFGGADTVNDMRASFGPFHVSNSGFTFVQPKKQTAPKKARPPTPKRHAVRLRRASRDRPYAGALAGSGSSSPTTAPAGAASAPATDGRVP